MPARVQKSTAEDIPESRREAGKYLRDLRERANLSQRELSDKVGFDYYTFISQIEAGRGKVPPERYERYAQALNVEVRSFVKTLLKHYHPITFGLLFAEGDEAQTVPTGGADDARSLEERLASVEKFLSGLKG